MVKIVLAKRTGDFHACVDGDVARCGCGKTLAEAVTNVIRGHHITVKDVAVVEFDLADLFTREYLGLPLPWERMPPSTNPADRNTTY